MTYVCGMCEYTLTVEDGTNSVTVAWDVGCNAF